MFRASSLPIIRSSKQSQDGTAVVKNLHETYQCRMYRKKTPDDWQRRCPKHVDFYNRKNWIVSASFWLFKKKYTCKFWQPLFNISMFQCYILKVMIYSEIRRGIYRFPLLCIFRCFVEELASSTSCFKVLIISMNVHNSVMYFTLTVLSDLI
jgi:hypothetical protein